MTELENAANHTTRRERGFIGTLASGDFGLAKMYWSFGVLASLAFSIILYNAFTSSVGVVFILMLAFTAYEIPVFMGIWRAANKYQGPKIWAVMAKITVVSTAIRLAGGLIGVMRLL